MSDVGREPLTDKAGAALKPDSQKTYTQQAGDAVKGKADSFASSAQPQSQKSTSQKVGDAVSGNSNENQTSLMDKAKDALGVNKQ